MTPTYPDQQEINITQLEAEAFRNWGFAASPNNQNKNMNHKGSFEEIVRRAAEDSPEVDQTS